MRLEGLEMHRAHNWETDSGKLIGKVKFSNGGHEISLVLSEESCQKILGFCAEGLVQNARAIAQDLTASIIEEAARPAALEAPGTAD